MISARDIIFRIQMLKGAKGDKGDKGKDGATISKVEMVGTAGNSVQYKITMTDGTTTNFSVPLSDSINAWMSAHPELTRAAVDAWMADHPEATTTINDGAVSTAKIANGAVVEAKLAAAVVAKLNNTVATGMDFGYFRAGRSKEICHCLPFSIAPGTTNQVEWIPCEKPDTTKPVRVWLTLWKKDWSEVKAKYLEITDKTQYNWEFKESGNGEAYVFEMKTAISDAYVGFIHLQYTGLDYQNAIVFFENSDKTCPTTVLGRSAEGGNYLESMYIRGNAQFNGLFATTIDSPTN